MSRVVLVILSLIIVSCTYQGDHSQFKACSREATFDIELIGGTMYRINIAAEIENREIQQGSALFNILITAPDNSTYNEVIELPLYDSGDDVEVRQGATTSTFEWGYRKNVSTDSLPGKWSITIKLPDQKVCGLGLSYKVTK